jgi:hypothetical protein
MVKSATDKVATETWMASQMERSDGISSEPSVYHAVVARPSVNRTGPTTKSPSQRRSRRLAHAT